MTTTDITAERLAWITEWLGDPSVQGPMALPFLSEFARSQRPLTDASALAAWCRFNLHGHGSLLG